MNWKVPKDLRRYVQKLVEPETSVQIGFKIDNCRPGKDVLVAGRTDCAIKVYEQLIRLPSLARLKGRLFLVTVDPLDDLDLQGSFAEITGKGGNFDHYLFLRFYHKSTTEPAATKKEIHNGYLRLLRMCVKNNLILKRAIIPDQGLNRADVKPAK